MLLVLKDRELPTPLKLVYEGAKVLQEQTQQKYYDILVQCKFVVVVGGGRKTKLELTERGILFLTFFEAIEKLMRGLIIAPQRNIP